MIDLYVKYIIFFAEAEFTLNIYEFSKYFFENHNNFGFKKKFSEKLIDEVLT